MTRFRFPAGAGAVSLALLVSTAPAGAQGPTALDGVYTAEQATRGQALYRQHCTYCHHDDLLGGEDLKVVPPALVGIAFSEKWVGKTVADFYQVLSTTMPWERNTLTPPVYADIVSYLLKENGYPPGKTELPSDAARLAGIRIPAAP